MTASADVCTALLLAAIDMEQVISAADMLRTESRRGSRGAKKPDNHHQMLRALETSIACCYARPMLDGSKKFESFVVPDALQEPEIIDLARLHADLITWRKKAYAHTDVNDAKREATWTTKEWVERWEPWITPDLVPAIIQLAAHQRDRFRDRAREIDAPTPLRATADPALLGTPTYASTAILPPEG